MDYVDWCGHALSRLLDLSRHDAFAASGGTDFWELGLALFGAEFHQRANRADMNSPEAEAVFGALRDLDELRYLERVDSQRYRVTRAGRAAARDFVPVWRDICAIDLEAHEASLLLRVNQLSHRPEADFAACVPVAEAAVDAAVRHNGDPELLRGRNAATSALVAFGFLSTRHVTFGDYRLQATYRGIVWETKRDLTETSLLIDRLVAGWETTSVDFKRELKLDTADAKASFVKDVLALANTPVSGRRWLVVGFDDETREVHTPPDQRITSERLEQVLHEYVEPYIDVRWEVVQYRGTTVGLLEVLPRRADLPHRVKKALGDRKRIEGGQTFVRHGTRNVMPYDKELSDLEAEGARARAAK